METLFFVASKLFWLVARPEIWFVLLLVIGFWCLRRDRVAAANKMLASALFLVLLIGLVPVGQLLMRPLETRFPASPDISSAAGIIVLGGGEDARMSAASGLPEFNAAGERLILGLALAQEYPEATLIFTGGSASLVNQRVSGADGAQALFARFEIADSRITLEPAARNTGENATRTYELVEDATRGPWVLVTSAFHMPRSVGSFCAAGWRDMIPYPVDYRAADIGGLSWSFAGNLDLLNMAIKEWIGLVAYSLTGRTPALLPRNC
ncbi:YdcF family protein [Aestuariicoccus sp. MJ-SS9]|uniref:YdcF family protein n=1 Tax=Aestuariicoccus sp. MJ-SS9 TaxID=3079855 RepID=UPI00291374BD|nr:YdcF family protein [Aestuariicoccus sp. MJ-SS9]MDU8913510.1 YdcF family protein [Aestuariicoccus sp. MJ-SS9]